MCLPDGVPFVFFSKHYGTDSIPFEMKKFKPGEYGGYMIWESL